MYLPIINLLKVQKKKKQSNLEWLGFKHLSCVISNFVAVWYLVIIIYYVVNKIKKSSLGCCLHYHYDIAMIFTIAGVESVYICENSPSNK